MEKIKTEEFSGFKRSVIDGSEHIFGVSTGISIPEKYSYEKYMPQIINQGEDPICVPCSISAFLNWRENLKDGQPKDNNVRYFEIYNIKTTEGEGMTFKEAFNYLRHHGVKSDIGKLMINEYAMVNSFLLLKNAIIMNGPCVGALPVYNYNKEFWNKGINDFFMGYHAISIVGYDKDGFIIRNSWGSGFGENGYTKIKYEEINKFIELWTIIR